jgi:hypothetical protein
MANEQHNIKCSNCGYTWHTEALTKFVTCSSCTTKTLNPLWLKANEIKLYRIWSYDSNDRSETARAIARDYETVLQFVKKTFIDLEELRKNNVELEETEMGLEWCESCVNCEGKDTEECNMCEIQLSGYQIEEIETPDSINFGETFDFKTIFGTNDFYDLTGKRPKKSEDWNKLLCRAFKIAPQVGADTLLGLTKLANMEGKDLDKSETVKRIDKELGTK